MTPYTVLWTSLSVHPIVYPSGLERRQPIEVVASVTALHALDHGFDLRLRGTSLCYRAEGLSLGGRSLVQSLP
jgi:hypothetical protein